MKTVWRPSTTHDEMMQHWITVYNSASYEAGFSAAFSDTGTWQQFVCDLETYYGIERRVQTCAGTEVPPERPANCVDDDDGDDGDDGDGGDGTSPGVVVGAVLGGAAVVALAAVGCAG